MPAMISWQGTQADTQRASIRWYAQHNDECKRVENALAGDVGGSS